MASQIRQNYDVRCEQLVNNQINRELYASYVYQAMSFHFNRDDVALFGFSHFFHKQSNDEREHAEKFMKYQNKRGGTIVLEDVKKPSETEWTPESAFKSALALEHEINDDLLKLHEQASQVKDPHLTNYLEDEFLEEQVNSIKEIADHLTNIRRNGPGIGVYLFDKLTLKE